MSARTWIPEIVTIGQRISSLTVAEATMLADYLEEVHGITAAALPALPPLPKPDLIVPVPVPTEFDVVLESFEAARKIGVIRAVRDSTGLGLKDARDMVDGLPKVVRQRLPIAEADKLKAQLEAAGANVTVKPVLE